MTVLESKLPVIGGTLGVAKATSISAVGDSIIANGWPAFDLTNGGNPPTPTIINGAYTTGIKLFLLQNFLLHASMRSSGGYFPFEFGGACSGATSQQIVGQNVGTGVGWAGVSPLDVFLGNPYGLPRMCVLLGGTNDPGNSLTIPQTLSALQFGYQKLIAAGIIPIAMTIPPSNVVNLQSFIKQLNWGIVRLAKSMQIPCADIYRALVNPSNGQWIGIQANSGYTADGTHPTALGASIMGDVLNQTIVGWFTSGPPFWTASFDDSTVSTRIRDPNLLTLTGSVNTSSSYPTAWSAPSTLAMSTVYNSSGNEPAGGHTMDRGAPAISGQQPNFLGNSWCFTGDGTHGTGNLFYNISPFVLTASVGDKLAFTFRIKILPQNLAATNVLDFWLVLANNGNGHKLAGIAGPSFNSRNDTCQIGGEPGYDSGVAYFEYTVVASEPVSPAIFLQFANTAGSTTSNAGDVLCVANIQAINLTREGIV